MRSPNHAAPSADIPASYCQPPTSDVFVVVALLHEIVLALIAFALWTSAIPGACTCSLNLTRDLGHAYGLVLVPLGLVFATLAVCIPRKAQL